MSDLTATNCGCGCENGNSGNCGSIFGGGECGCSILWILLLLSVCGGNNGGSFLSNNGCGCEGGNSCLLIILLLLFCNGGCGCGNY